MATEPHGPESFCERAVKAIGPASGFVEAGWAVADQLLGGPWAAGLAAECRALERGGLLAPHTFEFCAEDGGRHTYQHAGRSFIDLDSGRVREGVASVAPLLAGFATRHAAALGGALAEALPDLGLCAAPGAVQVKLQLTRGEHGCAPCHYDTSDSAPARQLTLLLYLSDAWGADAGGELQLMPFLGRPVALAPRFDRGVLFLADRVLHRSLPPRASGLTSDRWLLTVWFDGSDVDRQRGGVWPPLLQRLVAPALYGEQYLAALDQSLPPGRAREALRRAQVDEIHAIEGDTELSEMLGHLRDAAAAVDDADLDQEPQQPAHADGQPPAADVQQGRAAACHAPKRRRTAKPCRQGVL